MYHVTADWVFRNKLWILREKFFLVLICQMDRVLLVKIHIIAQYKFFKSFLLFFCPFHFSNIVVFLATIVNKTTTYYPLTIGGMP